jgi:adenosyl cobinamide kinase/adenosyl cobinamide phosphate guanylyltransferase
MHLILGGCYQGKRDYAKERFSLSGDDIFCCADEVRIDFTRRAVEHIERFVLACVREGVDAQAYFDGNCPKDTDIVLISDDVSCGVVPVDPVLRAWREACGRLLNGIARDAETVDRLFCGIPQHLK